MIGAEPPDTAPNVPRWHAIAIEAALRTSRRNPTTRVTRRHPLMKSALESLLRPIRSRFAALGLLGAMAVTVAWWFIVARTVWLAVEWASV